MVRIHFMNHFSLLRLFRRLLTAVEIMVLVFKFHVKIPIECGIIPNKNPHEDVELIHYFSLTLIVDASIIKTFSEQ